MESLNTKDYSILFKGYIIVILVGIMAFSLTKVCSITFFPDEFGYWADASALLGYDWSDVASMDSYYSFGYALILSPILFFVKDGILAYRIALIVNLLMLIIGFLELFCFARKIQIKKLPVLFSAIAVCYPAWFFYSQSTMAEGLLTFVFINICILMWSFFEKPKAIKAIFLGFLTTYMYFIHMRSLAILLAAVITVMIWALGRIFGDLLFNGHGPKRIQEDKPLREDIYLLIFLVSVLLLFLLGTSFKSYLIDTVYSASQEKILARNDYAGVFEKIGTVFSFRGIIKTFTGILGKLYYFIVASFGIGVFGLIWCVKSVWRGRHINEASEMKEEDIKLIEGRKLLGYFLIMSLTFTILLSSVYMVNDLRVDGIFYGRYTDCLIPIFIFLGLLELRDSRIVWRVYALTVTFLAVVAFWMIPAVKYLNLKNIRGYMMVGLCQYILDDSFVLWQFLLLSIFGLAFVFLIFILFINCLKEKKGAKFLPIILLLIELGLIILSANKYIYKYNATNFKDKEVAIAIKNDMKVKNGSSYSEGLKRGENAKIAYLKEKKPLFVGVLQLMLSDKSIDVLKPEGDDIAVLDMTAEYDYVICVRWGDYNSVLENAYEHYVKANTFYLYFERKE